MKREIVLAILRDAEPELRLRYGVISARLFGSVARDDADEYSDVDVAVRFQDSPFDPWKLCGVSGLLSGALGRDVDILAEPAKNSALTAAIDRDAILVF